MGSVIPIRRDTVREVLEDIETENPEVVIAFTMKDGEFQIHTSNIDGVTYLIGALERVKHELLQGQ